MVTHPSTNQTHIIRINNLQQYSRLVLKARAFYITILNILKYYKISVLRSMIVEPLRQHISTKIKLNSKSRLKLLTNTGADIKHKNVDDAQNKRLAPVKCDPNNARCLQRQPYILRK